MFPCKERRTGIVNVWLKKSPFLSTKSPAVVKIAKRTGCQWSSKWFKIDDFQFIWKALPISD